MIQLQETVHSDSTNSLTSLLRFEAPASPIISTLQQTLKQDYSPENLINSLKLNPKLEHLFAQDSGVMEDYTIEVHTLYVLHQFEKYFANIPLTEFSTDAMRITLALHDIGKSMAGGGKNQRDMTIEVLDSIREDLPLSDREFQICKALIGHDYIGGLLRASIEKSATMEERKAMHALGEAGIKDPQTYYKFRNLVAIKDVGVLNKDKKFQSSVREAAKWFSQTAESLGILPEDFLTLSLRYFQCDTAAYTTDATLPDGRRAKAGLDYLYEPNWYNQEERPPQLFTYGQRFKNDSIYQSGHRVHPLLLFSEKPGRVIACVQAEVVARQGQARGTDSYFLHTK